MTPVYLAIIAFCAAIITSEHRYGEQLTLKPLVNDRALINFEFTMSQEKSTDYTVFPRSLGQILEQSKVQEMHLRMNQGWWDVEEWGAEPGNGAQSGGIGVELWAWVSGDSLEEAKKNWYRLVHLLSGYFCASLNFIDETITSYPSFMIPEGQVGNNTFLMRGALPAEPVCTENLTPFVRLLPCKSSAGIGSLLDGHRLFDSQWQTMSLDIRQTSDTIRVFDASVSSVADISRLARRAESPLPVPVPTESLQCDPTRPGGANEWVCFPMRKSGAKYGLYDLFGHSIAHQCPLAGAASTIVVDAPANWKVGPVNSKTQTVVPGLEVTLSTEDSATVSRCETPKIIVDRSFTGWGQQSGGLRTVFTNPGPENITITYFETLPWFMRIYLHTLDLPDQVHLTKYTAAEDRGRPSQLEFGLVVPPGQVALEYKFDKSLLYLEEYPPDANHGFEIPPGVAVTDSGNTIVRTTSLLLSLPVPDFSMPYNVIILTSTVMTLAFGTYFNLISRSVCEASQVPRREKPLVRIVRKLQAIFVR